MDSIQTHEVKRYRICEEQSTLAVGAGQMSRVDSAKIASIKAQEHGHDLKGSVAASDAYFPFAERFWKLLSTALCGNSAGRIRK